MNSRRMMLAALCLIALAWGAPARAQVGGLIKRKAAEAVKEAAKKSPKDSVPTRRLDSAKAVVKPGTDSSTSAPAAGGAPAQASTSGTAATPGPADPKIWENYDFVPGSRILFFTDFSEDRVGNFARGLKYVNGPVEIVERDGVNVLRSTGRSTVLVPAGRILPQRFTLEIDVLSSDRSTNDQVVVEGGRSLNRGAQSAEVSWSPRGTFIVGSGQNMATSPVAIPDAMQARLTSGVSHIRVLMDSAYFKMYTNERRMYNIPELAFLRDSVIRVGLNASEEHPLFVTGIRLAESETDVFYDALASSGRWVTQGILFATGRSELQPESRPVLKEIASTMKEHGDLRILIEGHTDNVGRSSGNLALSEARAAAVKAALVAEFGIDAGRIATRGLGDTKPAAPNATAAGRAQNRRVEIVKQDR